MQAPDYENHNEVRALPGDLTEALRALSAPEVSLQANGRSLPSRRRTLPPSEGRAILADIQAMVVGWHIDHGDAKPALAIQSRQPNPRLTIIEYYPLVLLNRFFLRCCVHNCDEYDRCGDPSVLTDVRIFGSAFDAKVFAPIAKWFCAACTEAWTAYQPSVPSHLCFEYQVRFISGLFEEVCPRNVSTEHPVIRRDIDRLDREFNRNLRPTNRNDPPHKVARLSEQSRHASDDGKSAKDCFRHPPQWLSDELPFSGGL